MNSLKSSLLMICRDYLMYKSNFVLLYMNKSTRLVLSHSFKSKSQNYDLHKNFYQYLLHLDQLKEFFHNLATLTYHIAINLHFGEKKYNLRIRKNDNLILYCLNIRFSKHSFIESVKPVAMSCLNDLYLAFIRGGLFWVVFNNFFVSSLRVVIPNPYVGEIFFYSRPR
ncbi:hypothetical protein BpHYR1_044147 [Brachionus plicatilis]|uniref:Uncharacterized protein n=1 Tax=Brachionus plicatilis TaxID=10195 RepID=A0A3M7Q256_BRAPC|nr:hypothetical protein BpHYR1_044147 [Brachionus plicatilis]